MDPIDEMIEFYKRYVPPPRQVEIQLGGRTRIFTIPACCNWLSPYDSLLKHLPEVSGRSIVRRKDLISRLDDVYHGSVLVEDHSENWPVLYRSGYHALVCIRDIVRTLPKCPRCPGCNEPSGRWKEYDCFAHRRSSYGLQFCSHPCRERFERRRERQMRQLNKNWELLRKVKKLIREGRRAHG